MSNVKYFTFFLLPGFIDCFLMFILSHRPPARPGPRPLQQPRITRITRYIHSFLPTSKKKPVSNFDRNNGVYRPEISLFQALQHHPSNARARSGCTAMSPSPRYPW
ncbi:hypothetical protein BDBG_17289 [Blastomyces gilchristii SLH14081]|uniref:Uncharacterized protein n=1 Tax=Blastomyces gilchristii (strain SLH14081) TaxID=559298 RepID=A0A179URW1_BLAGS|nr:uncharacterized protein BDBG_17289 [Blastomyces gilchristii SLH14081]OAT09969.1 hypothetical protein BDBG_17289 [Blastomyces gilchristii SLH14081]